MLSLKTPLCAFVVVALAGTASAADFNLQCDVSKVATKHQFLPSEIRFAVAREYGIFKLHSVKIKSVKTPPVEGAVTYRGAKRLRFRWAGDRYVHEDGNRALAYGNPDQPPNRFEFDFSLNTETLAFRIDATDTLLRRQQGVGYGQCWRSD